MYDSNADDCPMPVPLREKIGITAFLAWLFYLGFVTRVMFAPLMPAIEADLGFSHAQSGSLFLMISIGYLIAPLCSGLISSRINHRGALTVSAWIVGLALIPFFFTTSLGGMRLLMILLGFAAGIHLPSAIATITAEVQKADWGKALSIHQAAPPLSFVSAPLIAAALLQIWPWRMVLMTLAGLALISALVFSLRGRGGDFPGRLPDAANVKIILSKPAFWIMVILFASAMGGNAGIYAMLPLFLITERGMELTHANTLIGLAQISGLLMVFVAGWLTDRIGQKPAMAGALLATGIATILMGTLTGKALLVVIFVQPALLAAFFPAAFAVMSRIAPPYLRSVTNALGPPLAFLLGGGLLPMLIGYMGQNHTFALGIIFAGGVMLLGPLLILFLKLGEYDAQSGC